MKQWTSDPGKQLKERLLRIVKKPKFRRTAEITLLLLVMAVSGLVLGTALQRLLYEPVQEPELLSARITTLPYRAHYIRGEEPDLTGMAMRLTYSNGTRKIVTEGFSATTQRLDTCGTQTITVGFEGFYDSFRVEVREATKQGTCGTSLEWAVADGILVITGSGAMADYTGGKTPWIEYAQSIYTVYLPEGLTTIGDNAFMGLSRLYQITLPQTLTAIGKDAFNRCTLLEEITLPASVATLEEGIFFSCSNLRKVTVLNPQCIIEGNILNGASKAVIYSYPNALVIDYARENNLEFDLLEN